MLQVSMQYFENPIGWTGTLMLSDACTAFLYTVRSVWQSQKCSGKSCAGASKIILAQFIAEISALKLLAKGVKERVAFMAL